LKNGFWIVLLGFSIGVNGQNIDTDSIRKVNNKVVVDSLAITKGIGKKLTTKQERPKLVPRKSTIYSLVLPSVGQIYNRDYWKLPIVYGALGAAVYTVRWNSLRYNDFLGPYLSSVDPVTGIPTNEKDFEVYIRGDDIIRTLTLDQVKRGKTFYRRYREYGYVIFAAVYALTAIEANVSAHLKTFDMSEDLTLKVEPSLNTTPFLGASAGVKLVFTFK